MAFGLIRSGFEHVRDAVGSGWTKLGEVSSSYRSKFYSYFHVPATVVNQVAMTGAVALFSSVVIQNQESFSPLQLAATAVFCIGGAISAMHEDLESAIQDGDTVVALDCIRRASRRELCENNWGRDLLLEAISYDQKEIALELIAKLPPEQLIIPDDSGITPLNLAIRSRENIEIALAMIARLTPDQLTIRANIHFDTPFHTAIRFGNSEIAHALIARLTPDQLVIQDSFGRTPFHLAVDGNQTEIALALIARLTSDQLIIKNIFGNTPLHDAIEWGRNEIALAIINKLSFVHLSVTDVNGNTPLHLAVRFHRAVIAKALLQVLPPDQLERHNNNLQDPYSMTVLSNQAEIADAFQENLEGPFVPLRHTGE